LRGEEGHVTGGRPCVLGQLRRGNMEPPRRGGSPGRAVPNASFAPVAALLLGSVCGTRIEFEAPFHASVEVTEESRFSMLAQAQFFLTFHKPVESTDAIRLRRKCGSGFPAEGNNRAPECSHSAVHRIITRRRARRRDNTRLCFWGRDEGRQIAW